MMQVQRVMSRDLVTANPLTTLESAARLMKDHDVGLLPVVKDGALVGVVTDRDLVVRGLADGKDGMFSRVADVMSKPLHCCQAEEEMEEAVAQMARHQVRRVMVVDRDGALLGLVALADIGRHDDDAAGFAVGEISETRASAAGPSDRFPAAA